MGKRAEVLAGRVEAGAELLAQFAEGLTDAEWNARVRDGRTVGVIVHHVASMYPVEVEVARAIAAGNAVEAVTWEDVAGINAKHAVDHAKVNKATAIGLLRTNSKEAAAAVREFSDAELDTAAGFSLSFGAPMTAQFVVEDHALRHAWHHLARIKQALGR
jgi:phage-related tail fiber protein